MMVAMMLPSLVPTLRRYRQAGLGRLTALVAVAYFAVWTVFGMVAYLLGAALPPPTPIVVGVVVLLAGFLQFTAWKARHLACCRAAPVPGRTVRTTVATWNRKTGQWCAAWSVMPASNRTRCQP